MQSAVAPSGFGQTAGVGSDDLAAAVAAAPFLGNTLGTGTVLFPRLSLEQYASFCGELAMYPERHDAVRRRYRVVSTASHRALSEHWQTQLADPAARAAFDHGFAAYTAWLRVAGCPLPPLPK